MFEVDLENGHKLIAYAAEHMRRYFIRTPDDRIRVELFADGRNGWVAGERLAPWAVTASLPPATPFLDTTSDGGATWHEQALPDVLAYPGRRP